MLTIKPGADQSSDLILFMQNYMCYIQRFILLSTFWCMTIQFVFYSGCERCHLLQNDCESFRKQRDSAQNQLSELTERFANESFVYCISRAWSQNRLK